VTDDSEERTGERERNMASGRRQPDDRPLYMISVAAELSGMHPQTLRIYERRKLIRPKRSAGNTRLYSDADIERLRIIQHLTQEEGINLAGVVHIMDLESEKRRLLVELDELRRALEFVREQVASAPGEATHRTSLVLVPRGGLQRRQGG
jgi:MerR family transcriptional regulator/heat shock protein HspR